MSIPGKHLSAVLLAILLSCCTAAFAQEDGRMTLDEAISLARTKSVAALQAKSAFISDYWAWRSYKASRLPSLNLYGGLANFDRSLHQMQNFETGELVYTSNFNLQNSIGLSLNQNITFTGGTLSLHSDLARIDNFGAVRKGAWHAQPVTLSYRQPLLAYNQFKWDKLISPKEYEAARRTYIESMETVTINAVRRYFNLLLAKRNLDKAVDNYENTSRMHAIAGERMKLGSVKRDEYLQLELRMLNDSIAINESMISMREAQMALNSMLGFDESELVVPELSDALPDIVMDYDMVLAKSLENSSFTIENEIKLLNAESAIAQAKANRGASMAINAKFGMSSSDPAIRQAYGGLLDQEVVGLSFSIPIFDWGMGRGRVNKAEARAEVVRAQVQQSENEFRQNIFVAVNQFNSQRQQCRSSAKAAQVARERYSLMMEKFSSGGASVLELNTAQSEMNSAEDKYVRDISNFWNYYYTLRKLTLHDFILGRDIDVNFEEMIK